MIVWSPEPHGTKTTDIALIAPPCGGKSKRRKALETAIAGTTSVEMGAILERRADGSLAPDEEAVAAWRQHARLPNESLYQRDRKFLYDGMPRTAAQAHMMCDALARAGIIDQTLFTVLERPKEECIGFFWAAAAERADRPDHVFDSFKNRLDTYFTNLRPILDALEYWGARILLHRMTLSIEDDAQFISREVGWMPTAQEMAIVQ